MKIKLITDSSSDVSLEFYKKNNIRVIPIAVILGDSEYRDLYDMTVQDIFDFVAKTKKLPKTAATGAETFKKIFEEECSDGSHVIYIGLGSALSTTFASAKKAENEINNGRVHCIDSKNLSTGEMLLLLYAKDLIDSNKYSPEEIVRKIEDRVSSVQTSFVVDTLEYLYKGGRCSMLAMFGANLLKLKPKLQVIDGKIVSTDKYRGKMLPVYLKYVDDTLAKFNNPDTTRCFITHASADEELVSEVVKHVKEKNIFKEVIESVANGTVTSHCGKGTLGILYINDGGNTL